MSKSWRDVLPIHPAADLFPMMSEAELKELGEDIKKNGMASPVAIYHDQLLDGRNRLDAMELVGIPFSLTKGGHGQPRWRMASTTPGLLHPWIITGGNYSDPDDPDPYALAISYNIHRRHLTVEQKLELIDKLIKATPEKSDRQIAEQIKASPTTVGKRRKKMEKSGDVSTVDTRTDTKGRKQPATKPGKHKPIIKKSTYRGTAWDALAEQIKEGAAEIADNNKKTSAAKAEPDEVSTQQLALDLADKARAVAALADKRAGLEAGPIDPVESILQLIEKLTPEQRQRLRAKLDARYPKAPDDLAIPGFLDRRKTTKAEPQS